MRFLVPAEGGGLFDQFGGLPVHPLVVHFAVVLLPVAALGLILCVIFPKLRRSYTWLAVLGLAGGTVAAFAAKESGEALATHVGLPQQHAFYGDLVVPVAVVTTVLAAVWFLLQRCKNATGALTGLLGWVAALGALISLVLTVLVGHSGATAVWEGRLAPAEATPPAATSTSSAALGMAEVAKHNTAADCWSVVDGSVYNLTEWVNKHPGGPAVITDMCGKDGTASFHGQHGTQREPASILAGYLVGKLSGVTGTRVSPSAASSSATAAPTSAKPSPKPSTFSLAEVRQHNSQSSCWSAIDGNVYDLTKWISRHPGGQRDILRLCGTDGTKTFHDEHHTEKQPNQILGGFEIGTLAG